MKHLEYRFTLGDKSWTLDIGPLTVDDYIELRNLTGFGVSRLLMAFDDMDPLVLKAMLWMARHKAGDTIAFDDPEMSFTMQDLRLTKVRDDLAKGKGGNSTTKDEESDPTGAPSAPKPRTRKPATRKTSRNS